MWLPLGCVLNGDHCSVHRIEVCFWCARRWNAFMSFANTEKKWGFRGRVFSLSTGGRTVSSKDRDKQSKVLPLLLLLWCKWENKSDDKKALNKILYCHQLLMGLLTWNSNSDIVEWSGLKAASSFAVVILKLTGQRLNATGLNTTVYGHWILQAIYYIGALFISVITSDGEEILYHGLEWMWQEEVAVYFKVLNLPQGIKKNYEKLQTVWEVFGSRIEPGTSRIRNGSDND